MQKQTMGYKIIIVSLLLLLVGSVAMGLMLAYFSNNANLVGSSPLSSNATIFATKNGTTMYSMVLPNDAIPFANYNQQVKIIANENFSSSYVRLKLNLNNNENINARLDDNWQKNLDGYFYLKNNLIVGNELELNINITLPKLNENENILNVVVESYEKTNNSIASCWNL